MNRILFLSVISLGLSLTAAQAASSLSDVAWTQDADTRQVTCTYTLTGDAALVTADVLVAGEPIDGAHLGSFIGDVNRVITAGEGHWLSWRPDKAWPGDPQDVTLRLKATAPADGPAYLVVDLSADRLGDVRYFASAEALPYGGLTNDVYRTEKLVLRRIPAAGVVWNMGSPATEAGRSADEVQHRVVLTKDYWMAVFETTQAQYKRITGKNPTHSANVNPLKPVDNVFGGIRDKNAATDETFEDGAFRTAAPAEGSFLGVLRAKTGLDFDLPTEAQWEYACRAGTTSAYNNGNDKLPVAGIGNFKDTNGAADTGTSHCVGSLAPNAWGLYDLHGNVWEWCRDSYVAANDGFASLEGVLTDPLCTAEAESNYRVRRGGSYREEASAGRSARRYYWNSSFQGTGFRVICTGAVTK